MGSFGRKIKRSAGRQHKGAESIEAGVAKLEQLTIDSRDLSVPVAYFHDELACLDDFVRASRSEKPELLDRIVEATLKRTLPGFEIRESVFLRLEALGFWHGFARGANQEFAAFYYFEGIGVGVAHVVEQLLGGKNHFIRFTGVPLSGPVLPGPVERGQG
ncbi:MAG: hypothetical protein L6Q84_05395 [Polyangiaceae bacterium]|nr:hypothetical protein [Polyangiaceae bacterium]